MIRRGGNDLHGNFYDYLENRNLNALDQFWKRQGIFSSPRYDYNLLGGALGGPIQKNKIFYYGNFDYNPAGFRQHGQFQRVCSDRGWLCDPGRTAGISQTNLNVMKQYVGAAPQQTSNFTSVVNGNAIPIGIVPIVAPSYQNIYRWLASGDYNMSESDQLRVRYVANNTSRIDTGAALPAFYFPRPTNAKLFSVSEFHAFHPNLANEVRLAYNRFTDNIAVPPTQFPGLDMFPNIVLRDLGTQIGPNANAPQDVTQNTYQIADNLTWIKGNHSLKFGFDGRDMTSAINFISNIRGNYQYRTMERYLLDLVPDFQAQRAVGGSKPYSGNNYALYGFANDDWKVTRNLSLSLGLRLRVHRRAEIDEGVRAEQPGRRSGRADVLRAAAAEEFRAAHRIRVFAGQVRDHVDPRRIRHRLRSDFRQHRPQRSASAGEFGGQQRRDRHAGISRQRRHPVPARRPPASPRRRRARRPPAGWTTRSWATPSTGISACSTFSEKTMWWTCATWEPKACTCCCKRSLAAPLW